MGSVYVDERALIEGAVLHDRVHFCRPIAACTGILPWKALHSP